MERLDVCSIIVVFVCICLHLLYFGAKRLEGTGCLSNDDSSELNIIVELKCPLANTLELAMSLASFSHGKLWVLILIGSINGLERAGFNLGLFGHGLTCK